MEEIFVPLIVFGFVALIVKMALDYNKWKQMHNSGSALTEGDNSMGASELRNLIEEAVHNANAPLVERISFLENQMEKEGVLLERKEEVKQIAQASSDSEG